MGDSVFASKPNPFHIINAVEMTIAKFSNCSRTCTPFAQLRNARKERETDISTRQFTQRFNLRFEHPQSPCGTLSDTTGERWRKIENWRRRKVSCILFSRLCRSFRSSDSADASRECGNHMQQLTSDISVKVKEILHIIVLEQPQRKRFPCPSSLSFALHRHLSTPSILLSAERCSRRTSRSPSFEIRRFLSLFLGFARSSSEIEIVHRVDQRLRGVESEIVCLRGGEQVDFDSRLLLILDRHFP